MECGEIWVKQKNDSEEENAEQFNMVNNDNKWRRFRRNRHMLREYYRRFRFIGWLKRKFDTTDRAKQADYLSSLCSNIWKKQIKKFQFQIYLLHLICNYF